MSIYTRISGDIIPRKGVNINDVLVCLKKYDIFCEVIDDDTNTVCVLDEIKLSTDGVQECFETLKDIADGELECKTEGEYYLFDLVFKNKTIYVRTYTLVPNKLKKLPYHVVGWEKN